MRLENRIDLKVKRMLLRQDEFCIKFVFDEKSGIANIFHIERLV